MTQDVNEMSDGQTERLHGIIPPLATPLVDRDTIDQEGLRRLIQHTIDGGVRGLFILGSTGEAPSLSYRLRRELIDLVTEQVDHRIPVLVGITDTAFVESIALAQHAKSAGADKVVLTTPYYFPAGQTELMLYVRRIVEQLPLPLMLYNMPSLTKVWFEIETLQKLQDLEQIVGVKDSSGDLEYYGRLVELKRTRPDWTTFIGPEHLLIESLKLGGDGGVSGGANVLPRLFVACYLAWQANDLSRATQLQGAIEQLQEIYTVGKYASRFIKATKCALSIEGICSDHMAEPFNHFLEPERQQVAEILSRLKQRQIW